MYLVYNPFGGDCDHFHRVPSKEYPTLVNSHRMPKRHANSGLKKKNSLPTQLRLRLIPKEAIIEKLRGLTHENEASSIIKEKDTFQVNLDIQHFAPEDISVKTVDGFVVVEAKHDEKEDEHGFVSRSFLRKYKLPETVKPEDLTSKITSDGVLCIRAPLKTLANERIVPISLTGPVKLLDGSGDKTALLG